ncbi:MAG: GMC family oxidoreductase N-terminal domain-containing protein [Solirubrobacteraceae bacterium]
MTPTFDVAVVGAGSAGCAAAARLSEDPNCRVVLLEAGGDGRRDPRITVPAFAVSLHGSKRDWGFRTEAQPSLDGRRLRWPRGRTLGGSSALNYLTFLRGDPACYDGWANAGCAGWAYRDVLPVFKRLEDHDLGPSEHHGRGGPVRVSAQQGWANPLTEAFLDAAEQVGLANIEDLDNPGKGGAGRYFVTVRDGQRASAATAYLANAQLRPNLEIRTGVLAQRLLTDGEFVRGVEISAKRRVERIYADAVILCAGAIGSPTLLLRSGIGPADEIRRLGIDPVFDAPQVGANLADHLLAPVVYAGPRGLTLPEAALRPAAAIAYMRERGGPWGSLGSCGVICRSQPDAALPDLQITFALASLVNDGHTRPQRAFTLAAVGLQPASRGHLRLRDANPATPPVIEPSYLSDERDFKPMLHGIRLARQIANAPALARWSRGEREPGSEQNSDAELKQWLGHRAQSSYHPVGTCRMGGDADAVVDPQLRLQGVEGLWVADASVMPTIVSANTNAACLMIGERAADFVRAARRP